MEAIAIIGIIVVAGMLLKGAPSKAGATTATGQAAGGGPAPNQASSAIATGTQVASALVDQIKSALGGSKGGGGSGGGMSVGGGSGGGQGGGYGNGGAGGSNVGTSRDASNPGTVSDLGAIDGADFKLTDPSQGFGSNTGFGNWMNGSSYVPGGALPGTVNDVGGDTAGSDFQLGEPSLNGNLADLQSPDVPTNILPVTNDSITPLDVSYDDGGLGYGSSGTDYGQNTSEDNSGWSSGWADDGSATGDSGEVYA